MTDADDTLLGMLCDGMFDDENEGDTSFSNGTPIVTLTCQDVSILYNKDYSSSDRPDEITRKMDANSPGFSKSGICPVVDIYGVERESQETFCMHVHGFVPYVYVVGKAGQDPTSLLREIESEMARDLALKRRFESNKWPRNNAWMDGPSSFGPSRYQGNAQRPVAYKQRVLGVVPVEKEYLNIRGAEVLSTLYKVEFMTHEDVVAFSRLAKFNKASFEGGVDYEIRLMCDIGMNGASWFTARDAYDRAFLKRYSKCRKEYDVYYKDIQPHDAVVAEERWHGEIAPLKIMSFDIECLKKKGFPDAEFDPVIQIATVSRRGANPGGEHEKVVFVLGSCDPLREGSVRSFETEQEMLDAWFKYLIEVDPDVITGYNILGFDFPYLAKRASMLQMSGFENLSRKNGHVVTIKETVKVSNQSGANKSVTISMLGRVIMDIMPVIRSNYKLRSYKLGFVATTFLGDKKDDVPYNHIYDLHNGTPKTRAKIAKYCLKDADLPLGLMDKLLFLHRQVEMCRVTGVTFEFILYRGQTVKVITQIRRRACNMGYLVPNPPPYVPQVDKELLEKERARAKKEAAVSKSGQRTLEGFQEQKGSGKGKGKRKMEDPAGSNADDDDDDDAGDGYDGGSVGASMNELAERPAMLEDDEDGYQGAHVLDPVKGHYEVPIATLDFASLYPSIMMRHNMCYSTIVPDDVLSGKVPCSKDSYSMTPHGVAFWKGSVRQGVLHSILDNLLTARKKAKKAANDEPDPFLKKVYDSRQNALKISANSVYGFTGAEVGPLPEKRIAASVTACGRDMLEKTRDFVEERFTIKNGYEHDAKVIYGDTDSVMVRFGVKDLKRAMELGRIAAEEATKLFEKPVKLEFEKVYWPYLLMAKKRYAGMMYTTNPDVPDKMDMKGVETVRRDNCLFVAESVKKVLDLILEERNPEAAKECVKSRIKDLITGNIGIYKLVISKAIAKKEYAAKQVHCEVVKRQEKRTGVQTYCVGERVPYIMVKGVNGSKCHERSEDPIYAMENGLDPDPEYYLKQLRKALSRIFYPIMGDSVSTLFNGDHLLHIKRSIPKSGDGMMKYAKIAKSCFACKIRLDPKSSDIFCSTCRPGFADIANTLKLSQKTADEEVKRVWDQCVACAGDMHEKCAANDCPLFFERIKVKLDSNSIGSKLESLKLYASENGLDW